MTPTYLGEIELSEETLTHYGVKGMRWRRRKGSGGGHGFKTKPTLADKARMSRDHVKMLKANEDRNKVRRAERNIAKAKTDAQKDFIQSVAYAKPKSKGEKFAEAVFPDNKLKKQTGHGGVKKKKKSYKSNINY